MNAYELADDLDNSNGLQYITKVGLVSLSSNMLRQQADELDKVIPKLVKANGIIENLRIRIAELEKDTELCTTCGGFVFSPLVKQVTPQTKPLSDEEIPVLGILHKAESVPLGAPVWETNAEFEKLKKIVITTVRVMEERILGK